MDSPVNEEEAAFIIYFAGGKYYTILQKLNGTPACLGKQLIDEVPIDSEKFSGNCTLFYLFSPDSDVWSRMEVDENPPLPR